jgi:hypothetical protein
LRRMELYAGDGGKALNLSDFQVSSTPDDDASILLANTNKLLTAVGISAKRIETTEELARVASSLFVAVYESLFHQRITGVVRNPQTRNDYERNAQLVIDSLSDQIQLDLKHITGRSIVSGDLRVLSNLVHILVRIVSLTRYISPMYLFLHRGHYLRSYCGNLHYAIAKSPSRPTTRVSLMKVQIWLSLV